MLQSLSQKPIYPWLLSISAGLLLSLAWYPPFTPTIFLALAPLIALERHLAEAKRPYLKFWAFSYLSISIWNIGVIWWLWNASGVATLGAWFVNALLQTFPLVLFQFINRLGGKRFGVLSLMGAWISFEYLHLNWSFSWPWLNLGNAFGSWPEWVQWYDLTGALGGSLWVIWANWLAYHALFQNKRKIGWALVGLLPILYSYILWFQFEPKGEEVEVVVVQPNLDCYTEKFSYNAKTGERQQATHVPYQEQIDRLIRLSEEAITENTRWVLWPETALHRGVDEAQALGYADMKKTMEFVQANPQLSVVTGIDSHIRYNSKAEHTLTTRYYEGYGYFDKYGSAVQVMSSGEVEFYHKSKLVIGAETVPLQAILKPLIMNFGGTAGGLGIQKEREVFEMQGAGKVAPVICYESVYGDFVTEYIQKGAQFIGVVTNDGWWGNTSGHVQHLYFSQLRAIETRRAVARSANTGISGFINQRGELVSASKYDEEIALRGRVHLNTEVTTYVKWGDYIGRLLAFITAFMAVSVAVKEKTAYKSRRKKK